MKSSDRRGGFYLEASMPAFTHEIETDAGRVVLLIRYGINLGYPGDGLTPREQPFAEEISCRFVSGAEEQADGTILQQSGFSKSDSEFKGRDYLTRYADEINEAVERHFQERQDSLSRFLGGGKTDAGNSTNHRNAERKAVGGAMRVNRTPYR